MGVIALAGGVQTMSSREIAELTGKNHPDVMRDIRSMVEKLTKAKLLSCANSKTYIGKDGRPYPQYELDRDTCLTLLLGYDPVARMKVVKRWQELEAMQGPDLTTEEGKLLLIQQMAVKQLALLQENKQQAEQLALAAPKVTYADAMTNADGTVLVRDAAKTLGVPVRKLEQALREKRVILPDNSPAAKYVTQGYFQESLSHYETNTRGRQISRTTRVTGRGLEFLRRFIERHAALFAPTPRRTVAA